MVIFFSNLGLYVQRNQIIRLHLIALLLAVACGCPSASNSYMPPPPPEITTVQPLVRDVVIYMDKNGETESAGKADVRSRVRGILKQIHFQSGQLVDEGALLYSIEDDAYKASEAAAVASLASVEAEVLVAQANVSVQLASVEQAQGEFSRQEQLIAQRATSQAELDAAKANLSSAQAALEAAKASLVAVQASVQKAQAQLENARLELSYTQIQSPIRGRLTQSLVQLGNLLEPGTELVTVVDSEKLYVNFSLSDREAIDIGDARSQLKDQQTRGPAAWSKTPVLIARETDRDFPFVGQMEYVSQEGVDVNTGTIMLRAIVKNDDGRLFPGMFVKLRVPVRMLPNTLLLPEYVIQSDRTGKYVFLLGEEMQPKRQPVKLGKKKGGWFVVESGVNQQDQIVSEGFHLLAPGGITPKLRSYSDSELPQADDAEVIKLFSPK